jgi:hypothetical protein
MFDVIQGFFFKGWGWGFKVYFQGFGLWSLEELSFDFGVLSHLIFLGRPYHFIQILFRAIFN